MVHTNLSVHTIVVNIHLLVACEILPEYYCTDAHIFSVGRGLAWCLCRLIGILIFGPLLIGNILRLPYPRRQTHIIGHKYNAIIRTTLTAVGCGGACCRLAAVNFFYLQSRVIFAGPDAAACSGVLRGEATDR